MANSTEKLARIHTLPQLIAYLRDEMQWPIQQDGFEEVEDYFFDYTPSDLGISQEHAAKIQEIKRLRPLAENQPWGVFFIKFEPKQLPVSALRRVLSAVAKKKRSSAEAADRKAWSPDDLLFISNYGEGEDRRISFAHFHESKEKKDLPTLRVLGWDGDDTELKLQQVVSQLTTKLYWPNDDGEDVEAWRNQWRTAFSIRHKEVIQSSKELATALAQLAVNVRHQIREVLAVEDENGPVTQMMEAFRTSLIHDMDAEQFSDVYAQTIAYGLFSARASNQNQTGTLDDLVTAMPNTNPFLRELMQQFLLVGGRNSQSGLDFDELGVSEVVALLDRTNMEAVLRDFGDKNPLEDPVIHFFEGFLKQYDAEQRAQRGVYYTPRPVVSFMVRSVDEMLRTEFGLEDGLADTTTWGEMAGCINDLEIPEGATSEQAFVQILDPATGTGTFLVEVIDLIHKTMTVKWKAEGHGKKKIETLWNDYVPVHLLPRLHGYELMMAPYAIAHMKIGLKLYETGYLFGSDERARVYLTNALEPAQDFSGTLAFAIPALAQEAEAVNAIKKDQRFTVVIGNPPYSLLSSNLGPIQRAMIEPYKFINGRQIRERGALQLEKNLNDDYVKFIRLGQTIINCAKSGVMSLITNHSYLDNPTMRGLRWSLLQSVSRIDILDLHGNSTKKESTPDGSVDKNVFAIKQGVAVIAVTRKAGSNMQAVYHTDLWGSSESKEKWLLREHINTASAVRVDPVSDLYLYVPQDLARKKEYDSGILLSEMMPVFGAGYITARDGLVVDFDRSTLIERISRFKASTLGDDELLASFAVSRKKGWDVSRARERLLQCRLESCVIPTNYRPFDKRHIFFDSSLVWGRSWPTMRHVVGVDCNLSLLATRMTKDKWDVAVSRTVSAHKAVSAYDTNSVFPLYLAQSEEELDFGQEGGAVPNYSRYFLDALCSRLRLSQRQRNGMPTAVNAEDIFYYAYAVFQSPEFRRRYRDFLVQGFPRLPLTSSLELFRSLGKLGKELTALYLLESPLLNHHVSMFIGHQEAEVESVSYSDETVWIDKAKTRGFKGVPDEVWNFYIGGYQVCEKWLKDRQAKGGKNPRPARVLTEEDIEHYQKTVVALSETIRIMGEIDEVIEEHGGWPGAFQTGEASAAVRRASGPRSRTSSAK